MVKCLVCSEFREEAKRHAGNNRVYLADGVRCDGKKKLQDIVDHLHGPPHAAALEMKNFSTQWSNNSLDHDHIHSANRDAVFQWSICHIVH